MIEIAVVDDHPMMVHGLTNALNTLPGHRVVHAAFNAEEFMDGLAEHPAVSIAIVDLQMRGTDGWEVLERLRAERTAIRTVAFSFNDDPVWISKARNAGARAYVLKETGLKEWRTVFDRLATAEFFYTGPSPRAAATPTKPSEHTQADIDALPRREREYLEHVLRPGDATYEEIGELMGVSVSAVDGYFRYFNKHWGVHTRAELLRVGLAATGRIA